MRACWHGFADTWDRWLRLTFTDRWLCGTELNKLIERSNKDGGGHPKDDR